LPDVQLTPPAREKILIRGKLEIGPDFVFSFGNRIIGDRRKIACEYLLERDGPKCMSPLGGEPLEDIYNCDIDRIELGKGYVAYNMRRTCHKHNSQTYPDQRIQLIRSTPPCARERNVTGRGVELVTNGVQLVRG